MGPAETYDVVVEPAEERAYTIFAEAWTAAAMRAVLCLPTRAGMTAAIPWNAACCAQCKTWAWAWKA